MSKKNNSPHIKISRIYNAPVKAVWDAWTDVKQVAQWWGPRGFTLTTHSKELRVGGHWRYTMHGPDGVDYPNHTHYFEVEKYKKLVYDHGGFEDRPPLFRVTVLFTDLKGKTKMDMMMTLDTPEAAEETRKFIRKANGYSTWDRLAEYLEKEISGNEQFVLNRSFDAPIEVLFEMWSNPQHISKWLAPKGFEMEYLKTDIRTGGSAFYVMFDQQNTKMFGRAQYREITRPNRLVYTQQFCDEKGNITRHPLAATWPATMLTTVVFIEEAPNETRITITWEAIDHPTAEEISTFAQNRSNMNQGWTGALDKLEEYVTDFTGQS